MSKKRSKLTSIENLLPSVTKRLGIDVRLKELMIMNYWSEIAQGKTGKDSRPHRLVRTQKGLILYVAAKSAMACQELNMVKIHLLDKLNVMASQIGLRVENIVFSTKYWAEVTSENIQLMPELKTFEQVKHEDDFNIDNLKLSEKQELFIEDTIAQLDFDEDIKNKLKLVMQRDAKLKLYKKQRGFPVCMRCGVTLGKQNEEFCPFCRDQE
jgi:rubrerythrin